MREPIDAQLARRRARIRPRRRLPGWGTSLGLHLGVGVLLFLGPQLFARPPERLDYVAVQIMPLEALGARDARPAPEEAPSEPEVPEPEPEPEEPESPPQPVEPEPEPEPQVVTPEASVEPESAPEQPSEPPTPTPVEPESPSGTETETGGTPGPLGSAQGDPRGTSPLGTTIGGLDNPDFTYSYYLDRMLALIDDRWRPPITGGRLEAVVHFRIGRDGTVADVELRQSSGNSAFDLAGLRAVQSASPLPPLPAGYHHETLGVNLILH